MEARKIKVRGEIRWVVPLGKRVTGKRIRVFGGTEAQALERAKEKLKDLRDHGATLAEVSTEHRGLIVAWRDRLTVEQMGEAFRRYFEQRCESPTVEKAVTDYIAANKMQKRAAVGVRSANGDKGVRFSRQHAADVRYRLANFQNAFSGRTLDTLIPGELETFVTGKNGSARNFFKVLHSFFAYARRHRWIANDPMAEVPRPAAGGGDKAIFKTAQMCRLLQTAAGFVEGCERHEPSLALLVLGGLCGLRYSEALRLGWEQVDLAGLQIRLDKLKTSKRGIRERFVSILPAAAAWLATLQGRGTGRVVLVNDKNARRQRARILTAAKLKGWPHNALRRSFGSYHYAAFENIDLTAAQMGHTSGDTTMAKYRTLARKADGEEWFALTPAKVQEIENVVAFTPQRVAS